MKRLLTFALLVCAHAFAPLASAQNAALMPTPKLTFLDTNGVPLVGGYLYTCVAGTSCTPALPGRPAVNPLATYTDASATVANANPIVLDAAGRANVWLGKNMYKIVVQDQFGVTQYSQDNVNAAAFAVTGSLAGANGAGLVTYTATGSGAVSRTVASKLGETVSVLDFGCVGNGTTDNSTCLQAAINAVTVTGGTLWIPPGIYNYSTTLSVSGPITITGQEETSNHANGNAIGADLHYTGTGTGINVQRTAGNGIAYRVKLRHFRLSSGTGATGIVWSSISECEMVDVGVGDGYSVGGGFTTGVFITNNSSLLFIDTPTITASQIGINIENSNLIMIDKGNIANNSKAHIKLGASTSYINISNTFFEGAPAGILVDDDATGGFAIVDDITIIGSRFLDSDAYTWGNARCVLVQSNHPSDSAHSINLARVDIVDTSCQATYSVNTASPYLASFLSNTAPSNRFSVTNFSVHKGYWIGGTTAAMTADTSAVQLTSDNPRSITSAAVPVPFFAGSGQYFQANQNGSGMDYTGHVGVIQDGEALALKGTTTSTLGFYQTGGSRTAFLGQPVNGNGALELVNSVSGASIYLLPTSGAIHVNGKMAVGPVDFGPVNTLEVADTTATTGNTVMSVKEGAGQAGLPFQVLGSGGAELFSVGIDGRPRVSGNVGLTVVKNLTGSGGAACTETFTGGILSASTCP